MIKVDNISKTYELDNKDKVIGIKNISFEVKEGEILGIMGRSGSGKTTLLRLLRGVEELDEGSITVSDVTVRAGDSQFYYNQLKKETAIHLQRSFGIWPETVRENVLRKLYARKYFDEESTDFNVAESEFGDEADKILDMVSLTDKADQYAAVLSGGEKQRIILARGLLKNSNYILIDEALSEVDLVLEKDIVKDILKYFKDRSGKINKKNIHKGDK